MTDNVIDMPKAENKELDNFFGPERARFNSVIIEGRRIPNLHVSQQGDQTTLHFDERFSYVFDSIGAAYTAANLAAMVMAVERGYPWHGAQNKDMPFAPTVMGLTDLPK